MTCGRYPVRDSNLDPLLVHIFCFKGAHRESDQVESPSLSLFLSSGSTYVFRLFE